MVWLLGLADVIRRAGYPVVEVAGWQSRGFYRSIGGQRRGDLLAVKGAICHHTATPWTAANLHLDYPSLNLVTNGRAGLAGPLAQLGLGRSGTWYVIAAGFANHAGVVHPDHPEDGGSYNVGIEAEASGVGDPRDWSAAQMDSYARGCRALMEADGFALGRVLGHKEIAYPAGRKIDPSFSMPAFRARIAALDTGGPPPPVTPPPSEDDDVVTAADRAAIAQEAANAVAAALGPALARAEDAAVAANKTAERALAEVRAHESKSVTRDTAERERDAQAAGVADDRHERRDRFNTRRYDTPGVGTYAELAAQGGPSYLDLSGAVIHDFPPAHAG